MKKLQVIDRIRKDCEEKGFGRKKWWAENLGVHQQTLSYWLNGQREPSGYRVEQINDYFSILGDIKESKVWAGFLRSLYFNNQSIDEEILVSAIKKILSSEFIDSRTLGFLSFIVETADISEFFDEHLLLRNRLGWLLEVSGRHPSFRPFKSKTMSFIQAPGSYSDPFAIKYLKRIQTSIGKRWHVYDVDISQIKRSYIGRLSTAS